MSEELGGVDHGFQPNIEETRIKGAEKVGREIGDRGRENIR